MPEKNAKTCLLRKLRNAQRLLSPVDMLNPSAPALTFPTQRTRNRRDHEKYLTLIDSIALLHQHQRPRGQHLVNGRAVEFIEVTLEDIALANQLAPEVLGRSLDEPPPQTRRLLEHLRELIQRKRREHGAKAATTFSRKELREASGWSLMQVRVHLERLIALEYPGHPARTLGQCLRFRNPLRPGRAGGRRPCRPDRRHDADPRLGRKLGGF